MILDELNDNDRKAYDSGDYKSMSDEGLAIAEKHEARQALKQSMPKPSKVESALRGAGQGLTLNFSDEALAGIKSLLPGGQSYQQELERERAAEELAREENPLTYTGSEIGGGIAGSFVPGFGLGKLKILGKAIPRLGAYGQKIATTVPGVAGAADLVSISKLKHIGNLAPAIGKAAGYAGLQSIGSEIGQSEDKAAMLSDAEQQKRIAKAGLIGAGAGAAGETLGIMAKLKAPQSAVSSLGATGREVEKKFKPQAGEYLLKNKLVGYFDNPEDISEKVYNKYQQTSQKIGKQLKEIPDLSKDEVVSAFQARINSLDPAINRESIDILEKEMNVLKNHPKDSFTADYLWNLKKEFDKKSKWGATVQTYGVPEAYKKAGETLRKEIARKAQVFKPSLAEDLAHAKKEFGMLYEINAATQREAARLGQRKLGGLQDMAASGGGALLGAGLGLGAGQQISGSRDLTDPMNILAAGAGVVGSRVLVPRIGSTFARTLDSKRFQNSLRAGTPALQRSIYKYMLDKRNEEDK